MLNVVSLAGRITHDIELKELQSGQKVVSFSVAVQRNFKNDGEYVSDFFNCQAWGNTAEFLCKYFKKGQEIALSGELLTRKYTDKDGNNRVSTYINVANVTYFGGSNKSSGEVKSDTEQTAPQPISTEGLPDLRDEDDLPF
ncbi:MAG: single-stranded DNA-binding protein [Clostridia bacterium]|nr:single-stranded DNA-binding protein [Clostridia bacterium]